MSRTVAEALEGLDFFLAAEMVQRLGNLSVIDHPTVKRLLAEALGKVHQFFQSAADKVKDDCYFARWYILLLSKHGSGCLSLTLVGVWEDPVTNTLLVWFQSWYESGHSLSLVPPTDIVSLHLADLKWQLGHWRILKKLQFTLPASKQQFMSFVSGTWYVCLRSSILFKYHEPVFCLFDEQICWQKNWLLVVEQ